MIFSHETFLYKYTQKVISEGWVSFLQTLAKIPKDEATGRVKAGYGEGRPITEGWKYTDKVLKLVIDPETVCIARCKIVNGKAAGQLDRLRGELLKYAGSTYNTCQKLD